MATEAVCRDALSLTGDKEQDGAALLRGQVCLQEAVQHGLTGGSVGVSEQHRQHRTGLRQPAAEQSTPQVRHAGRALLPM